MPKQANRKSLAQAARLYKRFSGHDASNAVLVDVPQLPEVGIAIGQVLGIMYETVRDGKVERYRHMFKASSRPLLVPSSDGKQLVMIGGSYLFTDRGIVDK